MTIHGWRIGDLCTEAHRNVFSRGSRLRVLILLATMIGSGLSILSFFSWQQMHDDVAALERQGWTTYIINAEGTSESSLSAESCFLLSKRDDVASVSAIGERTLRQYVQTGPRSIPTVVVGIMSTQPSFADGGAFVSALPALASAELINELRPVRFLTTMGGGTYAISAVLPRDLELADLGGSLVVPIPLQQMNGPIQSCVVTTSPTAGDDIGSSLAASVSAAAPQVSIRRILDKVGSDPYGRFLGRPELRVYVVTGLIFSVATAMTMRSRASELGLYRVTGMSRMALSILLGLESALILGTWASAGAFASLALDRGSHLPVLSSFAIQLRAIVVSAAASAVIGILVVRRGVTSMLKDR